MTYLNKCVIELLVMKERPGKVLVHGVVRSSFIHLGQLNY